MASVKNSINNTIGASNSGVTNTLTVTNPSDTASSAAQANITVGGTSAADPWIQWTVGTTRSYTLGIDNSDSDFLKLNTTNSATLDPSSGTEIMRHNLTNSATIFGGGTELETAYTLGAIEDASAAAVSLEVQNSSADASSSASLGIRVNGAACDDPVLTWDIFGVTIFSAGIDNSDADRFKLVYGTANLSAASIVPMSVATTGEVNFPSTCAFLAYNAAVQSDVTGDGTVYTVPFATEVYDQNNDFSSPTFTAPGTGRYHFCVLVQAVDIGGSHASLELILNTSNRTYYLELLDPSSVAVGGALVLKGSTYADMDTNDTATVTLTVSGSTKTVDVYGAASTDPRTFFSGMLAC